MSRFAGTFRTAKGSITLKEDPRSLRYNCFMNDKYVCKVGHAALVKLAAACGRGTGVSWVDRLYDVLHDMIEEQKPKELE